MIFAFQTSAYLASSSEGSQREVACYGQLIQKIRYTHLTGYHRGIACNIRDNSGFIDRLSIIVANYD